MEMVARPVDLIDMSYLHVVDVASIYVFAKDAI
jgi:hypothetical protein